MNWDRDRLKKILGTKGLSAALRQTPAFRKFREANLGQMQTELENKRKSPPELPPEMLDFDLESIVMKTFLNTQEGIGVARRVSRVLRQGEHRRDPGDSTSRNPNKDAAREAKIKNLDWELVGGAEHLAKLRQEISFVAQKMKKYDFAVFIEGPSGTGKELIAKEISKKGGR